MHDAAGVARELQRCKTVLLTVHKSPDGDALGSQLALLLALERRGKTVTAHNLDPVPEIYRFLPARERIRVGRPVVGRYDACVVLDTEPERVGLFDGPPPADLLINIDHHVTNSAPWPVTWLEPEASATGEMVFRLIAELGVSLNRAMAECLYTAVFTDTGSFRYSNTTPESMRIAAKLLEAGADPWMVTENVYESFAYRRLKLLGLALADMEQSPDGRSAWVVITDEMYRTTGTTAEDTDNFINSVRSVRGVEVAVLFRQTAEREFKISLRSKGRVDLTGVAQSFGGGGHRNAAGCTVQGTLAEVRRTVIDAVSAAIAAQLDAKDEGAGGRRP